MVLKKVYNIVILGEVGVGKSTFINAFANYINFPTLDDALKAKTIQTLIPTKFTFTDLSFNTQTIQTGTDTNESFQSGQSSTQTCRSYSFESDDTIIRLIDTPGVRDERGTIKDQENLEKLLHYITELTEIHAIVIMLKPQDAESSPFLKYCVKHLLSSLERSVLDNVLFLFSNSKPISSYNVDDTTNSLREILKEIKETPPNLDVRFNHETTFYLDNEAFKFLLAKREGHKFSNEKKQDFEKSWNNSVNETKYLLKYVTKLKPYNTLNTTSIIEARKSIRTLKKPLNDITALIENKISEINRLELNLTNVTKKIDELKLLTETNNVEVLNKIKKEEEEKVMIQSELKSCRNEKVELEKEKDIIRKAVGKFAYFLNKSSIIAMNDAYIDYLKFLIEKEKKLGHLSKRNVIDEYERLLNNYESEKNELMEVLRAVPAVNKNVEGIVKASDVMDTIRELYNLKTSGKTIKELFKTQEKFLENKNIDKIVEKIVNPIPVKTDDGSIPIKDEAKFLFVPWIQPKPKKECNILILGETGVGKSTFINAFSNYINFPTLDDALQAETIHALIPSKFSITDSSFNTKTIEFGMDTNESFNTGQSSTQTCRSYSFETDDVIIRLIDTPGIGDTRGVIKDQENFDNLLAYLGEFTEINAIVIMLKPNDSRLTVLFEYCIKQLLSSLERSAIDNIVFLFTNSRATFYNPGDTVGPLRKILSEIKNTPPNMDIRFTQENTFCLDNESFRFLLATRQGCEFTDRVKQSFYDSWEYSVSASKGLLKYVSNLIPHKIQNTISVMDARRSIERLRKPLGEISVLIENNLSRINRLEENLTNTSKNIEDLKPFLFVPRIKLKLNELKFPMTVCTHEKCTDAHTISDVTSYHYKQICHDHCYLSGVPKNVTGDSRLQSCVAMRRINNMMMCRRPKCGHSFLDHMHVYYTTEPYEEDVKDLKIETKITTKQSEKDVIEKELERYRRERVEFEKEKEIIQKAVAKFAHFLSNSVIIPYNDAYKEYLRYLIEKEKKLGEHAKQKVIDDYERLISNYEAEKQALTEELKKVQAVKKDVKSIVKASEVMNIIKELYGLKFSGETIKKMYDAQQKHTGYEVVKRTEKVVKPIPAKKQGFGNFVRDTFKYLGSWFVSDDKKEETSSKTSTTKTKTKTIIN